MQIQPQSIHGLRQIADRYDCFLVDQFGVLHDGAQLYPGVADALAQLRAAGKSVIILTNSGRRADANIASLNKLGISPALYTGIASSGEAVWQGIRNGTLPEPFRQGRRAAIVDKEGAADALAGLVVDRVVRPEDAEFILVPGTNAPKTTHEEYAALLTPAARAGVPLLCGNPDRMIATPAGLQPGAGAIAQLYSELGGPVTWVGKPYPALYAFALELGGASKARTLAVGDGLETDIAGGAGFGIDTLLIRTGLLEGVDDAALTAMIDEAPAQPSWVCAALAW
jgi:HAD superfamily hydrolase (TIGR01459 family)